MEKNKGKGFPYQEEEMDLKYPSRWKTWYDEQWKIRRDTFYTDGYLLFAVVCFFMAAVLFLSKRQSVRSTLTASLLMSGGIGMTFLYAYGRAWTKRMEAQLPSGEKLVRNDAPGYEHERELYEEALGHFRQHP